MPVHRTATTAAENVIDCDSGLGRTSGTRAQGGRDVTTASLLAEMDRVGIAEAFVYHTLAREYDPAYGNDRLTAELAAEPRLHPVWTVLPAHTREFPRPERLVTLLRDGGVRMVRMFPSAALHGHRFSLQEWCAGELLDALEAAGVPLAIDFGLFRRDEPPWADLFEVASRHPTLALVLVAMQNRNNRSLYPLLERFQQLHLATLGYNVHRGIEDVSRRFGAARIVFGSGYPQRSMGAARLQLDRAQLSEGERKLVASGNLRRLLGIETAAERS